MPLMRASVTEVVNNFPRITREVNELARESCRIGAGVGGAVCSQVASARSPGKEGDGSMAQVRVTPVTGTPDGWEASFISPGHESWIHNYGTLGKRTKALKQAPRSNRSRAPGTGIAPLRHLDKGRSAGRKAMRAHIAAGLPK